LTGEASAPSRSRALAIAVAVASTLCSACALVASGAARRLGAGAIDPEIVRAAAALVLQLALLALAIRAAGLDRRAAGLTVRAADPLRFLLGASLAVVVLGLALGLLASSGVRIALAPRAEWPVPLGLPATATSLLLASLFQEAALRVGLVGVLAGSLRALTAVAAPALLLGAAHAVDTGSTTVSTTSAVLDALLLGALFLVPPRPSLALTVGFQLSHGLASTLLLGGPGGPGGGHLLSLHGGDGWQLPRHGLAGVGTTPVAHGAALALAFVLLRRRVLSSQERKVPRSR